MSFRGTAAMVHAEYAGLIGHEAGAGAQNAFGGAALVVSQNAAGQATHSISAGAVLCPMTRSFARFVSMNCLMSYLPPAATLNSVAAVQQKLIIVLFAAELSRK